MYMIEINEDKVNNLAENVEKALNCMGKVMQCVNSLKEEEDDAYTSNYRTGYREEDCPRHRSHRRYEDEEERYSGRYSRM